MRIKHNHRRRTFLRRHSLTLVSASILVLWIALYRVSDPKTHLGSFFGNAIADWTGVVVMILATKYLYERGSVESKQPRDVLPSRILEVIRDHSLTLFLVATGLCWVSLYTAMDSEAKWGEVVGNIVSEWTQLLGLVVITKYAREIGSKEGN
jgi:hypothetical protein